MGNFDKRASGFSRTFSQAFSHLRTLAGAGGLLLLFGQQESGTFHWEPLLSALAEESCIDKLVSVERARLI